MAEILYKYRSLKNFKRFTDILFNKRLYSLVEFLGANIQYPAECEKAKIEIPENEPAETKIEKLVNKYGV